MALLLGRKFSSILRTTPSTGRLSPRSFNCNTENNFFSDKEQKIADFIKHVDFSPSSLPKVKHGLSMLKIPNEVEGLKEQVVETNRTFSRLISSITDIKRYPDPSATNLWENYVYGKVRLKKHFRAGDTIRFNDKRSKVVSKGPLFAVLEHEDGGIQAILYSKFNVHNNPCGLGLVKSGDAMEDGRSEKAMVVFVNVCDFAVTLVLVHVKIIGVILLLVLISIGLESVLDFINSGKS